MEQLGGPMKTIAQELCDLLPNYQPPEPQVYPLKRRMLDNRRKIMEWLRKGESATQIAAKLDMPLSNFSMYLPSVLNDEDKEEWEQTVRSRAYKGR